MNSRTTKRFRRALSRLPSHIRRQARNAYRLFKRNPYHASLQFKQVHPTKPIYSARVSRDYRAVAVRNGNHLLWFWIGPHGEYDKALTTALVGGSIVQVRLRIRSSWQG